MMRANSWVKLILVPSLAAVLTLGCMTAALKSRSPHAARIPSSLTGAAARDRYLSQIQPIFNKRCVVCHACVDAPCQLQLTSYEAVRRGATHQPPLVGNRVEALPPSRLKDAGSIEEWRARSFFPVVPESGQGSRDSSLLYRFIERGLRVHSVDAPAGLRESPTCVSSTEQFYAVFNQPQFSSVGMPYGLPPLNQAEFDTLSLWIADGAPGPSPEAQAGLIEPSHPETIAKWEAFLNQGTAKSQLVSRYIYEHAFLARLHFAGDGEEFYELIRSDQAPPADGRVAAPVHELVSPRPYDPVPGDSPIYYRLRKVTDAVTEKTHILWELDDAKLERLQTLFFRTPWASESVSVPGFSTGNPFRNFVQIPAESRARFMIENSKLIIEAMIRGPVCTGRTATYAIRDHFWIFFLKPESDVSVQDASVVSSDWPALNSAEVFKHTAYQVAQTRALKRFFRERHRTGFLANDVWDGDRYNRNAVLTVLRHENNASVHYGPIGGTPATAWVLSYSNFERMYYNLVADFMPWGNLGHRMATWTFMSFLRTEAEERFLQFLPISSRGQVRAQWNRGMGRIASFFQMLRDHGLDSGITVDPAEPMESLLRQLKQTMTASVLGAEDTLNGAHASSALPDAIPDRPSLEAALATLTSRSDSPFPQYIPNVSTLVVYGDGEPWIYTLVANRGYKFNNNFALESVARDRSEDTMIALPGVIGAYPELFYALDLSEAPQFLRELSSVDSLDAWKAFKSRRAVRRGDSRFWEIFDTVSDMNRQARGTGAGILDASHYDVADESF